MLNSIFFFCFFVEKVIELVRYTICFLITVYLVCVAIHTAYICTCMDVYHIRKNEKFPFEKHKQKKKFLIYFFNRAVKEFVDISIPCDVNVKLFLWHMDLALVSKNFLMLLGLTNRMRLHQLLCLNKEMKL